MKKIEKNFLVISSYNNDVSWVPTYTENYVIYDRSDIEVPHEGVDPKKLIKSPNVGYNLYDYFTFIIDNYENLPDCIIFAKGNIFPRHLRQEYFDSVMNNDFFTPLIDRKMHGRSSWPISFFDKKDGLFHELNTSWYTKYFKTKYFKKYLDFLRFCFKNQVWQIYTRFAPGANYIVTKEHILRLPKVFYENLRTFVSHTTLPGEAHIVERALYDIWNKDYKISEKMLTKIK